MARRRSSLVVRMNSAEMPPQSDSMFAVLAGKLEARRKRCAPVAASRRSTAWSMRPRKGPPSRPAALIAARRVSDAQRGWPRVLRAVQDARGVHQSQMQQPSHSLGLLHPGCSASRF